MPPHNTPLLLSALSPPSTMPRASPPTTPTSSPYSPLSHLISLFHRSHPGSSHLPTSSSPATITSPQPPPQSSTSTSPLTRLNKSAMSSDIKPQTRPHQRTR